MRVKLLVYQDIGKARNKPEMFYIGATEETWKQSYEKAVTNNTTLLKYLRELKNKGRETPEILRTES